MERFDPFGLVSGSVGLLLLVLGYLLKGKHMHGLMAGHARGLIADPDGAANYMGWFSYVMGGIDLAVGVLWYVLPSQHTLLLIAFLIANVGLPVIMFLAGDKYRRWPKLWE